MTSVSYFTLEPMSPLRRGTSMTELNTLLAAKITSTRFRFLYYVLELSGLFFSTKINRLIYQVFVSQ